jgi:hypothetical protein
MRGMKVTAAVALLVASGAVAAEQWQLSMQGLGPLHAGMTVGQVEHRAGVVFDKKAPSESRPGDSCQDWALPHHPGVSMVFIDGVLKRIDVIAPGVATTRGVMVGAPVARVMRTYPRIETAPDAYDDREQYLTVMSPDRLSALRFNTREGKVGSLSAGRFKEVRYIEGCS